jgi:plastocyanin
MATHIRTLSCGLLFTFAALMAGCGDNDSDGSPSPAPGGGGGGGGGTGTVAATITITASGASPRNVTIPSGSRVMFVNNDSRAHDMHSDPHPAHTDCAELESVGFLSAGQSRASGDFTTPRVCGFHDHDRPSDTSLQGTITIQ